MYKPLFEITPEVLRLITQATEIKTWIARAVIDVAWLPALQRDTTARLAHSSTSIEGNPLTLPEVEALARGEEIGASARAAKEVLNALAAMRWIWEKKPAGSIQEADLLILHRRLTQGTIPEEGVGRYKTRPNRIVDGRGRTVYTPPGPAEAQPMTHKLLQWLNDPRQNSLHPILLSAIAHHRLVSIHPFSDGNGRISRALGIWVLYTRSFDTHHLFALDEYFEEDRARYYQKIQQARDLDGQLTDWLEYVAGGIVQTLARTQKRIETLQIQGSGQKVILTKRQEDVLRYMRDHGRVRSSDLERAFKLTRGRLNQVLKPLVESGIIQREGQTRATTYQLGPR